MIVHISLEPRGTFGLVYEIKARPISLSRLAIYGAGFYYPLFYLQLDSAMHGLSKTFSFYSVEFTIAFHDDIRNLLNLAARNNERIEFYRTADEWSARTTLWCLGGTDEFNVWRDGLAFRFDRVAHPS